MLKVLQGIGWPHHRGEPCSAWLHAQPASHNILSVLGANVGAAPKAETTGSTEGPSRTPSSLGWIFPFGRIHFLHEPHVFFRVKSCRAHSFLAGWQQFRSSHFAGLFSLGGSAFFPWLCCISPAPGIASDSWTYWETRPRGKCSVRPHHAPWLDPDPQQARQTSLLRIAQGFLSPVICITLKIISSTLLGFPLSPVACSVLCPLCLFLLLIFPIDQMPWK